MMEMFHGGVSLPQGQNFIFNITFSIFYTRLNDKRKLLNSK